MRKVAKTAAVKAFAGGDASEIQVAHDREVLYDSLAGIVCLTGANIIPKAREIDGPLDRI